VEGFPPVISVADAPLVLIPPGDFTMGSDEEPAIDGWAHTRWLEAFYMAKYPITNAQFRRFIVETGRRPPGNWQGGVPPTGEESHPVFGVPWSEARAYCEWVSEQARRHVRLPTEAEWEKAARGFDGREYPWGDKFDRSRCNTIEGGIGHTTAVGSYSPQGDSPFGVADAAGNVLEWTSSMRRNYPYDPTDGREDLDPIACRIVRGGWFGGASDHARCAHRSQLGPDDPQHFVGFRIAASTD
jgi:formylglycine-generating enzyme required for sulfatase activity